MKKIIALVIGGVFAGILIGYFAQIHRVTPAETPKKSPPTPEVTKQIKTDGNKEKILLLQAIQELDLTSAELENAQAYIKKLERNTARYNWLVDYWKNNELDGFGIMGMGFDQNGFTPSDSAIKFFGWDKETVNQIKNIGEKAWTASINWEKQTAKKISASEDKIVFEIPPLDPSIKQEYLQSITTLIGEEDMALLADNLEQEFDTLQSQRQVEFSVSSSPISFISSGGDGNMPPDMQNSPPEFGKPFLFDQMQDALTDPNTKWIHIKETSTQGNSSGITMSIGTQNPSDPNSLKRWEHLFDPSQLAL